MSSEFFKSLETSLQQAIALEIRAYYNDEGVVTHTEYKDPNLKENCNYIVITQDELDAMNPSRHRVIEGELIWVDQPKQHWFLKQEDLSTNPYIGESNAD